MEQDPEMTKTVERRRTVEQDPEMTRTAERRRTKEQQRREEMLRGDQETGKAENWRARSDII
jgi:hypothetical protein